MTNKLETRDDYIALAADTRAKALQASIKAPVRRGYVMGVSVQSKRDIMSALRTDLININRCCVEAGFDPIFMDEDEAPVELPKPVK
tara:strand:+ start:2723 stop:2983 length:261 start_codon:yes stop_codon:yes gene_type:complete